MASDPVGAPVAEDWALLAKKIGPNVWVSVVGWWDELPPHKIEGGIPEDWPSEVLDLEIEGEQYEVWFYFEPEEVQ